MSIEEKKRKLCELFQCNYMEIEHLAERIIKLVFSDIDVNQPKT